MGTLSKYAGVESVALELPDGACYGDLLDVLGSRYCGGFPDKCWNRQKNEFVKPVSAIGSNGDIESRDTPLSDGEEIHVLIPVSGGVESVERRMMWRRYW